MDGVAQRAGLHNAVIAAGQRSPCHDTGGPPNFDVLLDTVWCGQGCGAQRSTIGLAPSMACVDLHIAVALLSLVTSSKAAAETQSRKNFKCTSYDLTISAVEAKRTPADGGTYLLAGCLAVLDFR